MVRLHNGAAKGCMKTDWIRKLIIGLGIKV